jgi:RNA polymerase sigma factor (sigma-70 family)
VFALNYEPILPISSPDFDAEHLFNRIVAGDSDGEAELYSLIGRCVRARLIRDFRENCEEVHHNIFIDIVSAIKSGTIRRPSALLPYIMAIVRHRKGDLIGNKVRFREVPEVVKEQADPAARADFYVERNERDALVRAALERLPEAQRELIRRFYYEEQPRESVMEAMRLSDNQFRVGKSRAIAKLRQQVERLSDPGGRAFLH